MVVPPKHPPMTEAAVSKWSLLASSEVPPPLMEARIGYLFLEIVLREKKVAIRKHAGGQYVSHRYHIGDYCP